jgi:hypothetical protein
LGEAKKADGDQEVGEGNEAIGCSMQPNQAGYPQAHGVGREVCVEDLIEKSRHKFSSSAVSGRLGPPAHARQMIREWASLCSLVTE